MIALLIDQHEVTPEEQRQWLLDLQRQIREEEERRELEEHRDG